MTEEEFRERIETLFIIMARFSTLEEIEAWLAGPDDDWEGPPQPEYSEYDPEAYDEMVREDRAG